MNNLQNNKRTLAGFILVLIGGFLLLKNLDLLPFFLPYNIFTWQVILILVGLFMLVNHPGKKRGFILIGIGVISLLANLFNLHLLMTWPVILVIVGLAFIFRTKYNSSI